MTVFNNIMLLIAYVDGALQYCNIIIISQYQRKQ